MDIDTSLLREKFVIDEKNPSSKARKALKLTCPSTRMVISLDDKQEAKEKFIIRTYNMHSCIRMVAQIILEYKNNGPILNRSVNWKAIWDKCQSAYDKKHNSNRWIGIYGSGNLIFSDGKYHQLFDVIEKCCNIDKSDYESSIDLAKKYFAKAGKEINMQYDSNVALVAVLNKNNGRCSIVLRGINKNSTFNYTIKPSSKGQTINIAHGLSSAADFLEAVQLAYMIGVNNAKLHNNIISHNSNEYMQNIDALKHIEFLDKQINLMEDLYITTYRPERPNFKKISFIAENAAK